MKYAITMFMSEEIKKTYFSGFSSAKTITLKKPINPQTKIFAKNENTQISSEEGEMQASKKQKFESFLTYRKRLSRLAIVQGLYFYEQFSVFSKVPFTDEEKANEVYRTIIYFYKRMFFYEKYGTNKKNKKLEERFVRGIITYYVLNSEKIDNYIKKYLSKKWRISRLNSILRAGLRGAICEALFSHKKQFKLIICEYTDLVATTFLEEKEIAFFNAILDNIIKEIKENYE